MAVCRLQTCHKAIQLVFNDQQRGKSGNEGITHGLLSVHFSGHVLESTIFGLQLQKLEVLISGFQRLLPMVGRLIPLENLIGRFHKYLFEHLDGVRIINAE